MIKNESHKEICQKHFESFLEKFKKIDQGAVSFKSFETDAADPTEIGLWMKTFRRDTCECH